MKNKGKIITVALLTSAIPAVVTYLGNSNNIIDYLCKNNYIGSAFDIDLFKSICQIASIILSFCIILSQQLAASIKVSSRDQKINGLLYQTKMIFQKALSSTIGQNEVNFDVRIFVPIKKMINFHKDGSLYFEIVNYDGLCTAGMANGLKFKVLPQYEKQGLVGECYNRRSMVYDDHLAQNNSKYYNLDNYQQNKTRDLEFCIVCPLYNSNNEVAAIISIDGKQKIDIAAHRQEVTNNVLTFSQTLYENVPELFKAKRRLI
ncbi:MAG: hypothetical protein NC121_16110 [Blautia sp.]|nr:hypothetical protein [Blautia sp.]